MSDRVFLDTNIFIYEFDDTAPAKREAARGLIRSAQREGNGMISFQVVQEFCSVTLRKFKGPFRVPDLRLYVRDVLAPMCEVHSSIELYESALGIMEETGWHFYDCLIVAAAARAGCATLYTEDLQHGRVIAGVEIVNPFGAASTEEQSVR